MTRLAWLTPGFPPDRGGVSDHSAAMVRELRALGHEILVCSKAHERGFQELDLELDAFKPEAIVVAYVPLGFAPNTGGVAPTFVHWCTRLRWRPGVCRVLLAHEIGLPVGKHWHRREFKLALLGAAHVAQFELVARCFDAIVFSHEGSRVFWARRLSGTGGRLHTIRICSSVSVVESCDPRAELAAAGYSVPAKTIFLFGTGHESVLFDYVELALFELLQVEPEARLVIVGMDAARLRQLRPSLLDFGPKVQALGFVPARQVSLWLQAAELVLAPLASGINARKTTAMAALQHGRALVTTSGSETCDDIAWAQICALSRLERSAFAAVAVKCLRDTDWRSEIGKAAQIEYEGHASASVTAAQLAGYLAVRR